MPAPDRASERRARAQRQALAAAALVQRSGGAIESTVRGDSMGGTLPAGSRIRLAPKADGAYPLGAVVGFVAGDAVIAHRIVRVFHDRGGTSVLITRGDARLACDPPIAASSVVGEVLRAEGGTAWGSVPAEPTRTWPRSLIGWLLLAPVAALARLDGERASVIWEAVIEVGRRLSQPWRSRAAGSNR